MNAASETRCIVPPVIPSSRNVPMTIVSRLNPMITPLRNPHRNHQNRDDDQYRFDQIDEESGEGPCYPFGLIEDLVASDACRKTFLL